MKTVFFNIFNFNGVCDFICPRFNVEDIEAKIIEKAMMDQEAFRFHPTESVRTFEFKLPLI